MAEAETYVVTRDIKAAVQGRETDVLDALNIDWRRCTKSSHIACPYPDHQSNGDNWRWDARKAKAFCSCLSDGHADSILDVVMKCDGVDIEGAKIRAAEAIGRSDLIKTKGGGKGGQRMDATSLLNPPAGSADAGLPVAYLAHRLGIAPGDVLMPSTAAVGWMALTYWEAPSKPGGKPVDVGQFPAVAFSTVAADGGLHCHRIYVAPGGAGKADLGTGPNGRARDPKKSAKAPADGASTAGRSVMWGSAGKAPHVIVTEGIETGAAVAHAFRREVEVGEIAVAAAISTAGVAAWQPWPATRQVTIAADRDEAPKDGRAQPTKAGERAARELGMRRHDEGSAIETRIVLPGTPGTATDWLDTLRADGVDAVRGGIERAARFVPTAAELRERAEKVGRQAELERIATLYPVSILNGRTLFYDFASDGRIWLHKEFTKGSGENAVVLRAPIASPFGITARLRVVDDADAYGLRLLLEDMDGHPRAVDIERKNLAAMGGAEARGLFLEAGVRFQDDGELVAVAALKAAHPDQEIRIVRHPGWHDAGGTRFYVAPGGEVIGLPEGQSVELAAGSVMPETVARGGTLDGWKAGAAAAVNASGCPHFTLGLAAGFAGVLVDLCGLDSVGINLSGQTSAGKTTAQRLAASVWSVPSARLGGGAARDAFDLQAPDADASGGARPLTVRAGQPDAPNPDGPLANAPGDGWMAGAAKGAATGVIKGASDAVGFVGGLGGLADYLIARGESAITGKPVDQVQAAHAARRKAVEADMDSTPLGRLAVATDPTNLLPAPDDVSGPILAKTGAYAPTSEPGRLAQAGVEAAVGAFGPGGGMVSPGTAGRAVAGALARQAPAMAAAGAASQGAVDATGSPLAGLAAGLVVPAAGEAVGAGVRGAAKLVAPVAGGSKLLNAAPVVGPALQAGREAAVAGKILGQSSDPDALRAWAAGQPDAPEVPNSPRTTAGSVGNDPGLFQAEKDARNVNNARPTATVTVDGQSYGGQSFNGVERAQSDAQVAALQGGQQDADVFRPGAMIRSRMDAIDAAAQQAEDRLNAAHADAVSGIQSAGQGFAADQQSGLALRTAVRQQAGADFADGTRAGLADRTADRVQGAADDASQAQTTRDDAHAALVQGFADARDRQLQVAQTAAAPLGEPVNAEDIGSTLRGAVEQVRSGAKDLHRDLYKAVDPDGTLALVATPVGDKAGAIMDGLKANGAELSPAEAPLFRRAAALPDVATYGTLHALDTDLSAAMSTERRTAGETSSWARLSQLKGSVKDAMTNAADNQAAHEARMVAAGRMAPEDTIAARLQQDFGGARPATNPEAGRATGTNDGSSSGLGTSNDPEQLGAQVPPGGRSGDASRGAGLQADAGRAGQAAATEVGIGPRPDAPGFDPEGMRAPPRPDVPRLQDLRAFVKSRGGMRDDGGDLASMGLHELIGRGARAVSPDRMREAAAEAGYLGADTVRAMRETHPNDLLDALSGDRPVHSVRDEDAAAAWQAHDEARERYDAARGEFGTRSRFGVRQDPAPLSAYTRDDIEGPVGMPLPTPANSGLAPNFGPEAAGRLKAANAAYAEYAKTYKNPTVGPGLRTVGYSGQYQRGDAAFIKGAVKPGPEGYENARAYLRAAQNDPDAVEAMHDAVLNPLRRAALGPGFLPPAALANWKSSYGPALRALDEVTPGFSRRFDDAGKVTQELLDMGAEHKAAIATARGEAARQAIVDNAARKAQLGQANAADKATVADLLAERAANDRAATQADKASTSSALSDRAASDRAAVAGSRADRDAGISAARGIVRDAKATPAAQFAKGGGTGVASTEVENAVGSFLKTGTTGATRLRGLVQSVQSDPEALAGLQKAGTDWIVRNHTNADGTLSGAKLISFVKQNGDSLRELYPHDQVSMMGAVARDAEAGARWRTTTAIKGGSDSVKNLLAAASENGQGPHTTLGMVAVEAVAQGFEHGGLQGAAYGGMGAAALYMMNAMRQAGIRRTSDLYMAALADPELARTLISKMPTKADSGTMIGFSRALKRGLVLGPMAVGEARASRAGPAR